MPWQATDAERHTKKADTPHKRRIWAQVANKALRNGATEENAIRQADAVVARMGKRSVI